MSRPEPEARVLLCGVIEIRSARGPGFVVGEPYTRSRDGREGVELVRPGYHSDPMSALTSGIVRALALVGSDDQRSLLEELAALPLVPRPELDVAFVGTYVARRREALGLSRRALARLAGIDRRTLGKVEAGVTVKTSSILAALRAVRLAEVPDAR